jgi:pimeloyl-ACP methyl ester carboxylesterase
MNQQLRIDGIDVLVEGEGAETIVMIHGWPDTYRVWEAQVVALKPHYRCVRFTLPGFDIAKPRRAWPLDEMMLAFEHIVRQLSPKKPVVLMLHDWGCVFGYEFYMRHPQLVSRIVGVDIGDAGSEAHKKSLSLVARAMVVWYQVTLAAAWRIGGKAGDAITRFMLRALKAPSPPEYVSSAMNYPYYILWAGAHGSYRQLRPFVPECPMLFIYGTHKPFLFHSPEWAAALAAKPGSQVLALKSNHWVMLGQSGEFNQAVLAWLPHTRGQV